MIPINRKTIRTIIWLGTFLFFIFLLWGFAWVEGNFVTFECNLHALKTLMEHMIPEIVWSMVAFIFAYFFFIRGKNIGEIIHPDRALWLSNGHENYKSIDWDKLLIKAKEVTIAAFYFEKWIIKHDESFRDFLKKKQAVITIYLPNFKNDKLMDDVVKLIPKYNKEEIIRKITETIREIKKRMDQEKIPAEKIKINLYDNIFNYTLQRFDSKLLFSINELCRETDYKSPYIEIDQNFSFEMQKFFEQELITLEKSSVAFDINTLK
jgi:hypothetical protein